MLVIHRIYESVKNMNSATAHDLDKLSDFFVETFPQMDRGDQVLARTIYQQLALGKPLSLERLAEGLNQAKDAIKEKLSQWGGIFYNDAGDIIGFWGIAVGEMRQPHAV